MSTKISFSDDTKTTAAIVRNMLDYVKQNWKVAYEGFYRDYQEIINVIQKHQPFQPKHEVSEYWLYNELTSFLEAHPPKGLKLSINCIDPDENKYIFTEVAFVTI